MKLLKLSIEFDVREVQMYLNYAPLVHYYQFVFVYFVLHAVTSSVLVVAVGNLLVYDFPHELQQSQPNPLMNCSPNPFMVLLHPSFKPSPSREAM